MFMTVHTSYSATARRLILACLALISSNVVAEEVLFSEAFKEGVTTSPSPHWRWDKAEGTRSGMMIAPGDIYEVSEGEERVSHRKALRLNFSGRNDFCNTCGGDYVEVVSISQNSACVIAPGEQYENFVYNLSNDFSTWKVNQLDQASGELCFNVSSPLKPSINGTTSRVSVGDAIYLPKQCGTSGIVGNDTNRRSDCSKAVNYLQGISSDDLGYGETIARRFYIYIPRETELPDVTFKLGYTRWYRNGKSMLSTVKISTQRDRVIELAMPNGERTRTTDSFQVPLDSWVYIEEVFTRESSEGATDGSYALYAHEASNYKSEPLIEVSGFELGQLRNMSIGGNWQHYNDASGYVYFDNIVVAKGKVGPVHRPSSPN